MKRRLIALLLFVSVSTLTGCSNSAYHDGYNEGYDRGYDDGYWEAEDYFSSELNRYEKEAKEYYDRLEEEMHYSAHMEDAYFDSIEFYSEYVVFIPTNNSEHAMDHLDYKTGEYTTIAAPINSYHNYYFVDCLDSSEYKACTIEEAENTGYVPCNICFSEDYQSLPSSSKYKQAESSSEEYIEEEQKSGVERLRELIGEENIEKAKEEELKREQRTYVYNNETGKMELKDE